MPQISRFFGISITMYFRDHSPPHFHARYAEHKAEINMKTLAITKGSLPPRQLNLVRRWATLHQTELLANWKRARAGRDLAKIEPLR